MEPELDERGATGAAYAAQVKAEAAEAAPAPPEGGSASPGADQQPSAPLPDDLKQLAAMLWGALDFAVTNIAGKPELALNAAEKDLLATNTEPVLAKHLPAALQAMGPELALLGAVALVYSAKLMGAPGAAPPPSSATVDGQAKAVAA